jgi:hypothetical protein
MSDSMPPDTFHAYLRALEEQGVRVVLNLATHSVSRGYIRVCRDYVIVTDQTPAKSLGLRAYGVGLSITHIVSAYPEEGENPPRNAPKGSATSA